jgi:hypothetical protein
MQMEHVTLDSIAWLQLAQHDECLAGLHVTGEQSRLQNYEAAVRTVIVVRWKCAVTAQEQPQHASSTCLMQLAR